MAVRTVSPRLLYLRLVLTMVFWGGTFVAGRVLSAEVSAHTAAAARFCLASVILLALLYRRDGNLPRLDFGQWRAMLLLGLSGVFAYNLFFFKGLQSVDAGRGALITGSIPAVVTLSAVLFLGERFSLSRMAGIGLAVCGALVVISRGDPLLLLHGGIGRGELFMLGCVLSWTVYSLVGKVMLRRVSPLTAVTCSCTIGAILLSVVALAGGGLQELATLSTRGVFALLYLALFGTAIGFTWFYQGVQAIGAARAALFVNLVPVNGVLLGILLLGETPDLSLWLGGGLVVAGLFLINRPLKSRE
jgi:drug/metabolite transporter (DMT)-like permease